LDYIETNRTQSLPMEDAMPDRSPVSVAECPTEAEAALIKAVLGRTDRGHGVRG
jgi:hypothetical protein